MNTLQLHLHSSLFTDHLRSTLEDRVHKADSMNTATSKAAELENRLISFGAQIINLSRKLPGTPQGRHICRQILRSGTATAANYGEARGAESHTDFVHKLGIVLKELNETVIWLELIAKSSLVPPSEVERIVAENRELSKIITASIKTARGSTGR
jgi:four helix bundle protein